MRRRNVQILVRLTKEEAQEFDKKVKKSGLRRETFLRQMITGFVLAEKPDKEFYDTMRELSAIGNRINQLAAKANALNFIDAPLIATEAKKWAQFQSAVQEKYLLPKKQNDGDV